MIWDKLFALTTLNTCMLTYLVHIDSLPRQSTRTKLYSCVYWSKHLQNLEAIKFIQKKKKTGGTWNLNLFLNNFSSISNYYLRHRVVCCLIGCLRTHYLIGNKLGQALISLMRNLREIRARDYPGCRDTHTPYLVYCWACVCLRSVSMVILGLFHAEIFWILLIRVWVNRILPMLWLHWFLNVFVSCFLPPCLVLPHNTFILYSL